MASARGCIAWRAGQGLYHLAGGPGVEGHPPAEKAIRLQSPQQKVGIADRRLPSAPTVTGRPRQRPGGFRSHLE